MCYSFVRSLIVQTGKRSRAARFCGSLAFVLALCVGCSTPSSTNGAAKPGAKPQANSPELDKPKPADANDAPAEATSLQGPNGALTVGDEMDKAKTVFPLPTGGHAAEPPDFVSKGQTHWGWKSDKAFFDALAEKGKLVWFSYMDKSMSKAERLKEIDRELDQFGEPAENAEGKAASVYSWERHDVVRVLLNLNSGQNVGLLRVVGKASVLQAQLPLGSLGELVRSFD